MERDDIVRGDAGTLSLAGQDKVMRLDRSPTRRFVLALIVLVLGMVGGSVLWLANSVRVARAEAREWREMHSEAKIVGQTPDDIVAAFGKPYSEQRGPDGKPVFIMYKQVKHGQYCGIAIKDGIAVDVSFSFQ